MLRLLSVLLLSPLSRLLVTICVYVLSCASVCFRVLPYAYVVVQHGLVVKVEDDPSDPLHAQPKPEGFVPETVVLQEEVVILALRLIRKNTMLSGSSNPQVRLVCTCVIVYLCASVAEWTAVWLCCLALSFGLRITLSRASHQSSLCSRRPLPAACACGHSH